MGLIDRRNRCSERIGVAEVDRTFFAQSTDVLLLDPDRLPIRIIFRKQCIVTARFSVGQAATGSGRFGLALYFMGSRAVSSESAAIKYRVVFLWQ